MPYPTSIRLPEDVRRVLRKVAKQNRRTVTEQINFVLQEWIRADPAIAGLGRKIKPEEAHDAG
jgi:hypothetical protein